MVLSDDDSRKDWWKHRHTTQNWTAITLCLNNIRLFARTFDPPKQVVYVVKARKWVKEATPGYFERVRLPVLEYGQNLAEEMIGLRRTERLELSFPELDRRGFLLVSRKLLSQDRNGVVLSEGWIHGQSVKYVLWRKGRPLPPDSTVLSQYPKGHQVFMDAGAGEIWLEGTHSDVSGVGPRVKVKA